MSVRGNTTIYPFVNPIKHGLRYACLLHVDSISCRIGPHGFQPLCVEMLTTWKPLDREQITRRQNKQMPPLRGFILSFCALWILDYHSLCVFCVIADGLQTHLSNYMYLCRCLCVVWVSHLKKSSVTLVSHA